MGRINVRRQTGLLLVLLAFSVVFWSCQDLALFLEDLDDQVKLANDRYLEVLSTYPEQNDQEINPSVPLLVTFDRDVNVGDIDTEDITIQIQNTYGVTSDYGGVLSYEFDNSDTLTIHANPFLTGGAKVIITLNAGLPAADGSLLRDSLSWSFYTGKLPAGTVEIQDGDAGGYTDALPGYANSTGNIGLEVDISKEVTHYYISTSYDGVNPGTDTTLTTESPTTAVTSWEPVDGDPAYSDLVFTIGVGGGDDPTLSRVSIPSISTPDGGKSVYIRFYDDEEETFSPILSDSTILDTANPTLSPSFYGGSYTNKSATVRAGAGDTNGIQSYSWSSITTPSQGTVEFGSPSSASSSVYVLDGKAPSPIEQRLTLGISVMDNAGRSNSDTLSFLDWDAFAAAPSISIEPDLAAKPDTDLEAFLLGDYSYTPAAGLDLVSEKYLTEALGEKWLQQIAFRWSILDDDPKNPGPTTATDLVPYNDIGFYELRLNDYMDEKKFEAYDYNDVELEWRAPDYDGNYFDFRLAAIYEILTPGYYGQGARITDKLENRSKWGLGGFSYLSTEFSDLLQVTQEPGAGKPWPLETEIQNRYPSFVWPLPANMVELEKGVPSNLEAKLYVLSKDEEFRIFMKESTGYEYWTTTIANARENFWLHNGPYDADDNPGGLPDLGGRTEVYWWYEIWYIPDGKIIYSSYDEEYGGTGKQYVFATGRY